MKRLMDNIPLLIFNGNNNKEFPLGVYDGNNNRICFMDTFLLIIDGV